MKTISCRQIGGPCSASFSGNSPKEILEQSFQHLSSVDDPQHRAVAESMKEMSENDRQKWMKMFDDIWANAPEEMPAL